MTRRRSKANRNATPKTMAADLESRPPIAGLWSLRPWLLGAVTALFVARPLFSSEAAATHGDGLSVVMLWIAVAVFWMLGAIGRPRLSVRFKGIDAAVCVLMLSTTVASLWAVRHGSPRPAINMLWEWIGLGLCFLMARQLIRTPREGRAMAAVMVGLAVAISAYAIYKWAYEMPQTLAAYDADPDQALRNAGMWFAAGSPERKLFRDRLASNLPTGMFALSNSLAGFIAPWLVVLAGVAWSSMRGGKRLLAVGLCVIPLGACLVLTRSRSGCIAAGLGLLLIWFLARRRLRLSWKGVAVVVLLSAVGIAAGSRYHARLAQASKSLGYRTQYWRSTVRMIADHPWLGCGPGNFQTDYTRYKLPEASEEVSDPHNFLLEVWATAGTPAAVAFLAVLACFMWRKGESGKGSKSEIRSPISEEIGSRGKVASVSSDAWLHVLGGGAVGFLLSVPLGMLSAATPGMMAVVMGLPLAAVTIVVLLGWIREGEMPPWLPAVGVAALLVDLLTTGGIAMPGVAGSLWLLLCLGVQSAEAENGADGRRSLPSWATWLGLVLAIGLAWACYRTAYHPVLTCQAHLQLSERSDRPIEQLEAAAACDPWAAEPWRRLTAARFDSWQHATSGETFGRFEEADANLLRLAPKSGPDWLASGDYYFAAAATRGKGGARLVPQAMGRAVEAYEKAVELYPNRALYRAKLAEAYRAVGKQAGWRREAESALRLDRLTPHADKKLPDDLRSRLVQWLGDAN
ncbi:MAG: O-antigen ligase family protein [Planctomycetaceae bacterium]|nr:O-antigen ligase family protein [Planctomycetaceae bacterium]